MTGGCGFFGAWITSKLLAQGAKVTIVDAAIVTFRLALTMSPEEIARINMVQANIDEPAFVAKLVRPLRLAAKAPTPACAHLHPRARARAGRLAATLLALSLRRRPLCLPRRWS